MQQQQQQTSQPNNEISTTASSEQQHSSQFQEWYGPGVWYPPTQDLPIQQPLPQTTSGPSAQQKPHHQIHFEITTIQPKQAQPQQKPPQKHPKPKVKKQLRGISASSEEITNNAAVKSDSTISFTVKTKDHTKSLANEDLSELSAQILQKITTNTYECMICFEVIQRTTEIWCCRTCWALFHIQCMRKWQDKSLAMATENLPAPHTIEEILNPPKPTSSIWRCPTCRHEHKEMPQPSCYCGKVSNAPFNPFNAPHSCGVQCGRMRVNTPCPHPCTIICHPGPCPPCPALGPITRCFCGKVDYRLRCSDVDTGKSCGSPCGKLLNCKTHTCQSACHSGPCAPCAATVEQRCYCGAKNEPRPCGTGILDESQSSARFFSCGNVCGRLLTCKNHTCKKQCHPGPCNECELLPSRLTTCPCGFVPLYRLTATVRKSCLDEIPTCGRVCSKQLPCGHRCSACCHVGECPPCEAEVTVPCRCKSLLFTLKCYNKEVPTCDKICDTPKTCSRHRCNIRCCPSRTGDDAEGNHICRIVCARQLKCGSHKCECPPCLKMRMEPLSCRCGKTTLNPPIPCGTHLPPCPFPCSIPRHCGHKEVPVYGDVHSCHQGACPPCTVLVEKMCMGGHELRKNIPCFTQAVSCGKACGKPMPCGLHTCARICHSGPCVTNQRKKSKGKPNADSAASPVISCGQPCGLQRTTCVHRCVAVCHPGQPCPDMLCHEKLTIFCLCKRRSAQVECLHGGKPGEGFIGPEQRELDCDDECAVQLRNKRLAEAFGILPAAGATPVYSDVLVGLARGQLPSLIKLEQELDAFVQSPRPHVLLSAVAASGQKYTKPTISICSTGEEESPSLYIYLGSVDPVSIELSKNLGAYCRLHWIDRTSAMAFFRRPDHMRTALKQLGGIFTVEEQPFPTAGSEDLDVPAPKPANDTSKKQPKKARKVPTPPPELNEPWRKNDNPFAALNNGD